MSRYIDAEWLKQNFNTVFWSQVAKTIDSAPSIDAVSVVRCGECKYRYRDIDSHVWVCPFGLMLKGDDGFCNYGEREGE